MPVRDTDTTADMVLNAPSLFALAGVLACSALLHAAEVVDPAAGEPVEHGDEVSEDRDRFRFMPEDLYIGFDAEYEKRRVRSSRPGRRDVLQENRDIRLDELVGLSGTGHVYDPALLSYTASMEFGLSQTDFTEELDGIRRTDSDSDMLHEYDLSIDMLRDKPLSLHAYARRHEQRIPRRFLPSLLEMQTEAGVSALATYGSTTTEFGLSWRDIERVGNRDVLDNETLEVSRFYIDHRWDISPDQQLTLRYDHDRDRSTYQGSYYDFDTRRDEFRLEHDVAFGPQKRHRLNTYLRYNEEQGDLARDEFQFVPRLSLEHSDLLTTIYRYGFYRFEQDAIEIGQHKFDVQALIRPRDDLQITVDGYGLYERIDLDVETYEFGGGVDVSYHRPTDLGRWNINAATRYDRSRTTGDAGFRVVRDEAHELGGSRPVYLRERYIELGSIVAHDAMRTRYYVLGIDYVLTYLPNGRVLVDRTLSGRIGRNEVVYFDYRYQTPADHSVDALYGDLLVEHAFDFGLTPYYALEARCEEVDAGRFVDYRPRDNMNRHRLGMRYGKNRYEVGTEIEFFDDSVEPYDAWHLTGRAQLYRTATHSIDTSAELSRYWFEGGIDDRDVWWFDMDIRDHLQLSRHLLLTNGLDYHWEDDSLDGETNGLDLECGLEFARRYLTVELIVEYDLLSILDSSEQGFGVYLNIRRDLSHLLTPLKKEEKRYGDAG